MAALGLCIDAHGASPPADIYSIGQIFGWARTGHIPQANTAVIPPAAHGTRPRRKLPSATQATARLLLTHCSSSSRTYWTASARHEHDLDTAGCSATRTVALQRDEMELFPIPQEPWSAWFGGVFELLAHH